MTVSNLPQMLRPPHVIHDHYMLLPIEKGFDWQGCFIDVEAGEWYVVVFRSKHRYAADEDFLNWLDRKATEAAQKTPGFLYYFTGTPLLTGECLSFCLWQNRQAAIAGAAHPEHRVAIEQGINSFEYYELERHVIRKHADMLTFTRLEALAQPPVSQPQLSQRALP